LRNQDNYKLPSKKEANPKNAPLEMYRQEVSFSTHLPPPEIIRQYNDIIPSFGQDVHNEFLNEVQARRSNDKWIVKGTIVFRFTGQLIAFVLAVLIAVIAWDLGRNNQPLLGGVLGGLDLVALVSVFLGVQYFGKERKDARTKKDTNPPLEE
jgi:uncharacterized membrane protein